MKKLITITFSILLCLTCFTGCQSKPQDAATPTTEASATPVADDTTEKSLEGILANYSGEIITLKGIDGNDYLFQTHDEMSFVTDNDLYIGDDVVVYYTGTIDGVDTTNAKITKVEDKSNEVPVEQTFVGIVVDAAMNTLTVTPVAGGENLTFTITDADMETESGIIIGNTVYIDYHGEIDGTDTSKAVVVRVIDNDDNEEPIAAPKVTATPIPTATPKPTLPPASQIKYVSQPDWMTVVADAPIYQGNSTAYKKVGKVWSGQGINTLGYTNDGWIVVNQEGTVGYVVATDLTKATPAPTATPKPTPKPTATPVPTHVLTIHYQDQNGNPMFSDFVKAYAEGASYSIKSPVIVGSGPSVDPVTGTMGKQDQVVTVVFTPIVAPAITGNTGPAIGDGATPE